MTIDVDYSGIFWSKAATDREIAEYQRDVLDEAALQIGVAVVQDMADHFIAPRPYYWTTVDVDYVSATRRKVTDHGSVVYNFWLEGIGSRNYPVTRFRGYGVWRRQRALGQARADSVARELLPHLIARLNG